MSRTPISLKAEPASVEWAIHHHGTNPLGTRPYLCDRNTTRPMKQILAVHCMNIAVKTRTNPMRGPNDLAADADWAKRPSSDPNFGRTSPLNPDGCFLVVICVVP
jgi:hypothetical protein